MRVDEKRLRFKIKHTGGGMGMEKCNLTAGGYLIPLQGNRCPELKLSRWTTTTGVDIAEKLNERKIRLGNIEQWF